MNGFIPDGFSLERPESHPVIPAGTKNLVGMRSFAVARTELAAWDDLILTIMNEGKDAGNEIEMGSSY